MMNNIISRTFVSIFSIWLAVSLAFFALRLLPGDAIQTQFAQSGATPEQIEDRRAAFGLDQHPLVQYGTFWSGFLHGDLGMSLYGGQTVTEVIQQSFPQTFWLAGLSMVFAVALGIMWGVLSAMRLSVLSAIVNRMIDLSLGVPVYWTATITLYAVVVQFGARTDSLWLPVAVLSFHTAGAIAQVMRVSIFDQLQQDYVLTARSKGLHRRIIWQNHMLSNAILPVLPVIALQSGYLFSGTIFVETIFQRVGIGYILWDAVLTRNYPVVQGIVVIVSLLYVTINWANDVLIALIDPRLRRA